MIRETQGYTTVCRGATVNYHGTATDDDGASTDTHGRNSVSTETVRKHYGNTTETLRNSVSTPYCVVHGYPRKARESDFCMYGGRRDQQGCVTVMQGCVTVMQGCVTDALRFDHSVAAPRKATEVLNSSKHSWPLPDHHGSPGIMKDHDGLFQGLTTFHHGTWIRGDP